MATLEGILKLAGTALPTATIDDTILVARAILAANGGDLDRSRPLTVFDLQKNGLNDGSHAIASGISSQGYFVYDTCSKV